MSTSYICEYLHDDKIRIIMMIQYIVSPLKPSGIHEQIRINYKLNVGSIRVAPIQC